MLNNETHKARHPDPEIDMVIGRNLKRMRLAKNLALADVSDYIGVSLEQCRKYETGENRVSIGRALQYCAFFDVTLPALLYGTSSSIAERLNTLSPEALEIAMAYDAIVSDTVKQKIRDLTLAIAQAID